MTLLNTAFICRCQEIFETESLGIPQSVIDEIIEKYNSLNISNIPEVKERKLDKILELRKKHSEGKMPPNSDAFLTMQ